MLQTVPATRTNETTRQILITERPDPTRPEPRYFDNPLARPVKTMPIIENILTRPDQNNFIFNNP